MIWYLKRFSAITSPFLDECSFLPACCSSPVFLSHIHLLSHSNAFHFSTKILTLKLKMWRCCLLLKDEETRETTCTNFYVRLSLFPLLNRVKNLNCLVPCCWRIYIYYNSISKQSSKQKILSCHNPHFESTSNTELQSPVHFRSFLQGRKWLFSLVWMLCAFKKYHSHSSNLWGIWVAVIQYYVNCWQAGVVE